VSCRPRINATEQICSLIVPGIVEWIVYGPAALLGRYSPACSSAASLPSRSRWRCNKLPILNRDGPQRLPPGAQMAVIRFEASWHATRMTRKLKTYQSSVGFYDLAIAAPSMKAALEAWGAGSNLFHQGVAKESGDPEVIAATMLKPGVVLRRPVGSNAPFSEHSDLPTHLADAEPRHRPKKTAAELKERVPPPSTDEAASKAIVAFEKEQRLRENQRRKEEAVRKKQRERRDHSIAKAQALLEEAKREHDERVTKIEAERGAVERKSEAENARWVKLKDRLERALRRASE